MTPYLFDNYTSTYTTIENGMIYDFTVDQNQPETASPTRFKIVFTNTTLSIDNPNLAEFIHLYPNPSKAEIFNLSLPAALADAEVQLYNDLGQKIAIHATVISNHQIQYKTTHTLSNGIYHVVISPQNGNVVVKKWVVNN